MEVLDDIEKVETDSFDKPKENIFIIDCGEIN